ncbi:MAG: rhomboid family intramembrane serine protease [Nitrospirota bacterium]
MIPLKDSNPTERFPIVTVVFITLNILVFLYQTSLGEDTVESFVGAFSLVPARLFHAGTVLPGPVPDGVTLFTSLFLHGGLFHLIGNMLYLWIFGNNVEDAMGRIRFIVFYLLCGVLASMAHALMNAQSSIPMIGASGAVSGILGAYVLLYPKARVLTLFTLGFFVRMIEVPALVVLGFWFVFQSLNALVANGAGGVAWYAHIGGFLAGLTLIILFKRRGVPFGGKRSYRNL